MPKILIADDSIAVRKVAERLLTEAGMGVTLAANGSEALALLSKDRPDLIVSDVIMPDKSGYEVCAFIRAQTHLSDVPVLLISGIVNDEVSRQADACKADGVLKKPFQGTSLKDRVMDLLTKRQAKPEPMAEPAPASAAPLATEPAVTHLQTSGQPTESEGQPLEHAVAPMNAVSVAEPSAQADVSKPVSDETTVTTSAVTHSPAEDDARIQELQEQLDRERREVQDRIQQMQSLLDERHGQITDLSSHHEALVRDLAQERERRMALATELEEAQARARRADALEAELAQARQNAEELSKQIAEHARHASRIAELEAHLSAERGAAGQLVQQLTALEHVERRAHELEVTLTREREQAEAGRTQMASMAARAAQIPELERTLDQARARATELEAALTAEREAAALVMTQVKQLETVMHRAHDLDLALAAERERSEQLQHRLSEVERSAEQATRRFEDLVRKLGEIAGLASQLGSGKR
jgi:DNA-binding response OmpR family regulator